MSADQHAPVLQYIVPEREESERTETYALLDGARNPRILPMIRASHLDHQCLYSGQLGPRLAAVAPYIVIIPRNRDSPFTQELLNEGFGNSWGMFLESDASLQDLRRHFRKFLRVEDESGRKLIFRFYDPRVFRVYVPTCNPDELGLVFGPVTRYLVESDASDSVIEYRLDGRGLQTITREA